MRSDDEIAREIDRYVKRFSEESWAYPQRKFDVLLGLQMAARIARGEVPFQGDMPMKNYRVRYTRPDGEQRVSAVDYDQSSAEGRKQEMEMEGHTDVEVIEVEPGSEETRLNVWHCPAVGCSWALGVPTGPGVILDPEPYQARVQDHFTSVHGLEVFPPSE